MKILFSKMSVFTWVLCSIFLTSAVRAGPTWIVPPTFSSTFTSMAGPDGIRGTADDLPGPDGIVGTVDDYGLDLIAGTADDPGGGHIYSGYSGGSYLPDQSQFPGADKPLTANVHMTSIVYQITAKKWHYTWTITNSGTGPFEEYWDTGRGPNFIQPPPPLYGTAGPDHILDSGDDVPPGTQTDSRDGGPPRIGQWGGRWNPEVGLHADRYEPIPEPASLILSILGLGTVAVLRRRRTLR